MMALVQDECVRKLADLLRDDAGRRAYIASHGACVRHLSGLLAATTDIGMRRFLLDEAASHLEVLAEDMQSFALKQEATRRHLVNSNEYIALRLALEKIAGFKTLCFPWEFDEIS